LSFRKRSVRDADVAGRSVLVRADLNVPLADGRVTDDTRIRAALPTLELLREHGARIVVASHLGRPKDREPDLTLAPVATRLGELLRTEVALAPGVVGEEVEAAAASLQDGQILLLENTRFEPGETKNDPALARGLAALAEVYVNDAFGTAHRAHASNVGVAELLPSFAGLLLEKEVEQLESVRDDPDRPLCVVLGGAKVSDKIALIERFMETADDLLIGGAMCFSFFAAEGRATGDSLVEEEGMAMAARLLASAGDARARLHLPTDLIAGDRFDAAAQRRDLDGVEVPDGWMGLDIGPRSAEEYAAVVNEAGTVLWNGPMGAFELEPFAAGTRAVAEAVASSPGKTVVGGGDSAAAMTAFGLADSVDWLSSGGGAALELLEGRLLPGVEVLADA
jgi:phosphoglycerate kinase